MLGYYIPIGSRHQLQAVTRIKTQVDPGSHCDVICLSWIWHLSLLCSRHDIISYKPQTILIKQLTWILKRAHLSYTTLALCSNLLFCNLELSSMCPMCVVMWCKTLSVSNRHILTSLFPHFPLYIYQLLLLYHPPAQYNNTKICENRLQ